MRRFLTIVWAFVRCNIYLLFRVCWKGEREFTIRVTPIEGAERLVLIAASSGNFEEPKIGRIFWVDKEFIDEEHLQRMRKGSDS